MRFLASGSAPSVTKEGLEALNVATTFDRLKNGDEILKNWDLTEEPQWLPQK